MTDCVFTTVDVEVDKASRAMTGTVTCGVHGVEARKVSVTIDEVKAALAVNAYVLLRQKAKALCKREQER